MRGFRRAWDEYLSLGGSVFSREHDHLAGGLKGDFTFDVDILFGLESIAFYHELTSDNKSVLRKGYPKMAVLVANVQSAIMPKRKRYIIIPKMAKAKRGHRLLPVKI